MKSELEKHVNKAAALGSEVIDEMVNQVKKWNIQNHCPMHWLPILMEEVGEASKEALNHHFKNGNPSKELQDSRLRNYRKEMIQVAAVAMSMIISLDKQIENDK